MTPPNFTQGEYDRFLARTAHHPAAKPSHDDIREAQLHQQILEECKRRGWVAFHGSTAHKTKRTLGEPDFIIAASTPGAYGPGYCVHDPVTFYIECKIGERKLTAEQLAVKTQLEKLEHDYHVVRSFAEFLEVVG